MAAPANGQAVVDLLDDSSDDNDEEEEAVLALSKARSLRTYPAVKTQAAVDDTIDLCESDDGEKPTAKPSIAAAIRNKKKRSKPSSFCDGFSTDDGEDELLLAPTGFSRKPSKAAAKLQSVHPKPQPGPRESLANAAYFVSKAKEAAENCKRSSLSQEGNLNDAEILNYSSGLLIHRTAHQTRTARPLKAPPSLVHDLNNSNERSTRKSPQGIPPPAQNFNSDDEEDALLNYNSGFARSAPRSAVTSSAATIAVTNPYTQKAAAPRASISPPVKPRAQPFTYPKLSTKSIQYPDERARYLLAFWTYGKKNCTRRSFERPKLDSMAKRVVRLALSAFPIRSLDEYVSVGATSVTVFRQLRDDIRVELDESGFHQIVTPVVAASSAQKYYSITEACLVTLLKQAESQVAAGCAVESQLSEKDMWVPLTDLIPAIDRILRPECPGRLTRPAEPDFGADHYLQQSTRSMEFLQVCKLECNLGKEGGPFIKRHTVKGKVHYELLQAGYEAAMRLRSRQFPAPPGHYRCSKITTIDQVDALYPNICLGVDRREGGGGGKTLHQMCNKLEMMGCPFFVGSLSIGDYVFFTSKSCSSDSMDLLCPIVIERKSVQDVAMSIFDGRWENQKLRMYVAQYVFGYENCHMVFIIEGNENKQMVTGDYVAARWYDVDKEKLRAEIDNLKLEGFSVLRTTSVENSMFELARWAQTVAGEMKAGTMQAQYTYAEFKQKVAEIPKQTDFSRIAKDHMQQKQLKEAAMQQKQLKEAASRRLAAFYSDIEVLSETVHHSSSRSTSASPSSPPSKPLSKKPKLERNRVDDEFFGWTKTALQEQCAIYGLPKTGSRADLVARLKGPRPPKLWLERKKKKQYVPERHDVAGTALLVALYLHEKEAGSNDAGLEKEALYIKAEGLEITKNPFSGGTTQTGPYHYDGWAGMSKLLIGDPALVIKKSNRYKLTRSCDIAGYKVAEAMHTWCHQHNNCPCGAIGL